jgi:uncharacterized membrane protein
MESWHPLIVHFPLVLLPLGVAVDLLALGWKKDHWHGLGYGILWLGTLLSAGAVLSGNAAAGAYRKNQQVQGLVSAHEDWATWTLLLFLALALSRLPLQLQGRLQGGSFKIWLVVATAGCILLWVTGYTGGEMVYRHGVGVKINH